MENSKKYLLELLTKDEDLLFQKMLERYPEKLSADYYILANNHNSLKNEHVMGTVDYNEYNIRKNKILVGLLAVVNNLSEVKQIGPIADNQDVNNEIDELQKYIQNSSVVTTEGNIVGYNISKQLVKDMLHYLDDNIHGLGRDILWMHFDNIGFTQYFKLFHAKYNEIPESLFQDEIEDFKKLMRLKNKNDRWEYLKFFLGRKDAEKNEIKIALKAIGRVYFYKIPFTERIHDYEQAYNKVFKKYDHYVDGYFSRFYFMINKIQASNNKSEILLKINSVLNVFDLILIYYHLLSSNYEVNNLKNLFESINLTRMIGKGANEHLIDAPSDEELKNEFNYIGETRC